MSGLPVWPAERAVGPLTREEAAAVIASYVERLHSKVPPGRSSAARDRHDAWQTIVASAERAAWALWESHQGVLPACQESEPQNMIGFTRPHRRQELIGPNSTAQRILRALAEHGPLTDRELADYANADSNTVRHRRAELAREGLIESHGKQRRPQSNQRVAVWALTWAGAREVTPAPEPDAPVALRAGLRELLEVLEVLDGPASTEDVLRVSGRKHPGPRRRLPAAVDAGWVTVDRGDRAGSGGSAPTFMTLTASGAEALAADRQITPTDPQQLATWKSRR